MTRPRRSRATLVVAAAALAVAACGGSPDASSEDRRARPEEGPGVHPVAPARYVTDVSFVPFLPDARGLHFRFRQATSSDGLRRDYLGWSLESTGWRPLLVLRDTVPVPRAGWRVLPAAGLRVVAGRGGGLRALVRRDSAGGTRLELGRTLARWKSPTGQHERFRLSTLVAGGERRRGLAVERRSARALEAATSRGLYGYLLAADSTGEGLVILRHGGTPPGRRPPDLDTTAVAYGWTDAGEQAWSEVRLEAVGGPEPREAPVRSSPPAGWELVIPAAGLRGRIAPGPVQEVPRASVVGAGDADDPRPVRIYDLSGTLSIHGETRSVRGIGVEAGEP